MNSDMKTESSLEKITLKALHSVQSPVRMLAQHPVRKLAQHPVRMLAQHWSRHTNLPPPTHIPSDVWLSCYSVNWE